MALCFSRFFSAVVLIFCMGLATAPAMGQCPDDDYEPNNDQSAAKLLDGAGSYPDLFVAKGDEDWYYLNVEDRDFLTITATFTHSLGDIELYLYNESGTVELRKSNSSNDNEAVEFPVQGDGVVKIRVEMYTPDKCNDYSLDIDIVPNYCQEDIYEENDDLGSAIPVGVGTINNLVSGDGDEDWFAIDVLPGDELTVSALHDYASGNIDLYLYDDTGKEKAQSISLDDDEVMTWASTFEEEKTVYAKVIMVTPDGCNDYSLNVAIVEPCVEDTYDLNGGNDDKNSATLVSAGEYPDLVSGWGNEDWFKLPVQTGDALLVAANFDTAAGNIDMFLMDSDGTTVLASGDSITDNELLAWTSPLDGEVYIRVVITSEDGCNGYALNIGSEDGYEENDTRLTAKLVGPGDYPGLVVASGDEDWYVIEDVCSGSTLTLTAAFTHLLGDIDLYLYDGSSNELARSTSPTDNEEIVWESTLGGTVYLRVINYSPDTFNRYALSVQLSSDCQPPVAKITSPPGCSYQQDSVSVEGVVSDGQLAGWTLEYTRGDANNDTPGDANIWIPIASGTEGVDGVLGTWDTSELDPCTYILRLIATDDDENWTEYNVSVNVGYLADLDRDGKVDLNDLAKMASEWLSGS